MLINFESKSARVKGLSFHPKRPWILSRCAKTFQHHWCFLLTKMGPLAYYSFSSTVCTMAWSSYGTTECVRCWRSSTNTMVQCAAFAFTISNRCSCLAVTTSKSKYEQKKTYTSVRNHRTKHFTFSFGTTKSVVASSHCSVIWTTFVQRFFITSILGFWALLMTRPSASGTGSREHVFLFWLVTIIMWCVPCSIRARIRLSAHHWIRLCAYGTSQVSRIVTAWKVGPN